MKSLAENSAVRTSILPVLALLLAGCFGTGDGPTPIAGTPAPPPPDIPAGFCDPINFEDLCGPYTFTDFEGGATAIIDNPDVSGSNMSDKVVRMQKFEVVGGGTFGGTAIELPNGMDFSAGESFTMQVWSPRQVPVLFKFEGLNQERSLNHSGSGSWETLCYDFAGTTSGPAATAITVIFDITVMGDAGADPDNWTFYFDEITQVDSCSGTGGNDTAIPVDFEADPTSYDFGADGGFGGGASDVIDNPDASGINTSGQVARMQKFAGETFGGSTLFLGGNVDFTAGEFFNIKVWSQRQVPVLFKFEGLNQERSVDHTGGSAWQELCFDFSGSTAGDPSIALTFIFDLGVNGDAMNDPNNWVFYFDDIQQGSSCGGTGGGSGEVTLPVTFDDSIDYELQDFGGVITTLVADPDDAANTVASSNKPLGAELWGGTTVANVNGFGALPFSATDTTMTLRVWSPDAGIPVRLKVEDGADATISVETEATTTVAAGWEVLTFDFANQVDGTAALDTANTYDKASVFFNFGTDGNTAGDKTYLWENLTFVTGGGGSAITLPVTFDAAIDYELQDFGGVISSLVADPDDAANTVVSSNKPLGAELWGGTTVANVNGFGAIPFTATDTTMTLRVYSPDSGIPVRLKVEDVTDPTISVETEATTTGVNTWETLTFDFASQVDGTAALDTANTYDKASAFFNFGTDGNTAGDKIYLWDDLTFVSAGGGGGGGATSTDFEGASYTFADFGGAVTAVVANPDASGINTSAQVGESQKFAGEVFAGTTLDLGGSVDLASGDSYKMKVRAQRSVVVTLKLETGGQETTSTHSGSGTWEELCFDFDGTTGPVTGLTIIFDNGTAGDAAGDPDNWTFQFDDIVQTSDSCSAPAPAFATITFDDAAVTYTLTDFGGVASVVTNDPAGGTNMVAQSIKSNTAELWGGTTISTGDNESVPAIPLDESNTVMTVQVYSPDSAIPVRLKIEDAADPTISVETEAMTTTSNAWEELSFDFANQVDGTAAFDEANTYNKISIFFNFGTDGATAGEKTYYADNVATAAGGGGGGSSAVTLPVTFDDTAVEYELQDFGGVITTLIADPDDAANTVASSNKPLGAELWGGTTVADVSGFGALPFTATDTTMTLRVYSPDAGIPVRLKVEDRANAAISVETEAMTTAVNTWETLTFNFDSEVAGTPVLDIANTYDKASVFFNFGTDGNTAGDKTYLWEDLTFVGGGGGGGGGGGSGATGLAINGDFETGDLTGFDVFENNGMVTPDNTENNGGSWSVHIVAGPTQNPVIKQSFLAPGTVAIGDIIDISFDMKGTASAGGVIFPELIEEGAAGAAVGTLLDTIASPTSDWTNYSYSPTVANDVTLGITFQLAIVCGGDASCVADVFIDNINVSIRD